MNVNVLIAGGGVIGSAVAWALAERGVSDVVVVDLTLKEAHFHIRLPKQHEQLLRQRLCHYFFAAAFFLRARRFWRSVSPFLAGITQPRP